jgi:hypothetical protein
VDGPVKFHTTLDGKMNLEMISQYGRSFSLLRIPYSLKLLIQELQVMNVQMRIITEENIDQLMSMSFSDNIIKVTEQELKLVQPDVSIVQDAKIDKTVDYISKYKNAIMRIQNKANYTPLTNKKKKLQDNVAAEEPDAASPDYPNVSPAYQLESGEVDSRMGPVNGSSVSYNPTSYNQTPNTSPIQSRSPTAPPPGFVYSAHSPTSAPPPELVKFGDEDLEDFFKNMPVGSQKQVRSLPLKDQILVLKNAMEKKKKAESILNVPEEKTEEENDKDKEKDKEKEKDKDKDDMSKEEDKSSSGSGTKTVSFNTT